MTEKNTSEKKVMVSGGRRLNRGALRGTGEGRDEQWLVAENPFASTAETVTNICPNEGRRLLSWRHLWGSNPSSVTHTEHH